MASTNSFSGHNYGVQIGSNPGTVINTFSEDPLDKLPIACGAEFSSYADQHEDNCLPGTRTELRETIAEWAVSPHGKCIFWLNGMAGTGKSTIARTVAKTFKEKGQLGASFFFKRGEADRGNAERLISTITRQLVTSHGDLAPLVSKAIKNDPNISAKSLSEQFDKLLLQPLLRLNLNQPTITVIVIDALDECEQESDIKVILQLLPRIQQSDSMQLRIFLTSRPELPIRLGFKKYDNHQDLVLHKLPKPVIEHNIRLFLKDRLLKIRDERSLPSDWPGDAVIERLVGMAVPLFIFAATVCRFVGKGKLSLEKRLENFLKLKAATSASQMGKIYLPVLHQLLDTDDEDESMELGKQFQDIIGTIIILATPLSINALGQLLDMPKKDIGNLLSMLHLVLSVPEKEDAPVRILHLLFRDFLVNTKSGFYINEEDMHTRITLHCLRIMNSCLKQNLCGLPSYGMQRADITRQAINQYLPEELQYSCRYWATHLEQSKLLTTTKVLSFLKIHFLHWLEAMSLMGFIPETIGIISNLQSAIGSKTSSDIVDFLHDAKQFILKNMQIANAAPL